MGRWRWAAHVQYCVRTRVCAASAGSAKKDWVTGESVFGELKDGSIVHVSTGLARRCVPHALRVDACEAGVCMSVHVHRWYPFEACRLIQPDVAVLTALGAALPFEIAAGMNGFVWITAHAGTLWYGAPVPW